MAADVAAVFCAAVRVCGVCVCVYTCLSASVLVCAACPLFFFLFFLRALCRYITASESRNSWDTDEHERDGEEEGEASQKETVSE